MQPTRTLAPLLLGLFPAALLAQQSPSTPAFSEAQVRSIDFSTADPWTEVGHDRQADGSLWSRGRTFKAGFSSTEGATFVPFFGSQAPRNFPLALSPIQVTTGGVPLDRSAPRNWTRSGDRVWLQRAGFREVYDLTLDAVEQSFVFEWLPQTGDLEVVLDLRSELTATPSGAGWTLENEWGGLSVSHAFAFDAEGHGIEVPVAIDGQLLRMVVPASFVATAALPLTLDPVFTPFLVPSNHGGDEYDADIAFNFTDEHYVVVTEVLFSGNDYDVRAHQIGPFGAVLSSTWVEMGSDRWRDPRIAWNAFTNRFLVVAEVVPTGTGNLYIRGRAITDQFTLGADFDIDTISGGIYRHDPDVGGNLDPSSDVPFCVVYERVWTTSDSDVLGRLVDASATATTGGFLLIDNVHPESSHLPEISKHAGAPGVAEPFWAVVYEREAGTVRQIYAARVGVDGAMLEGRFRVDGTTAPGSDQRRPDVSAQLAGADGRYLISFDSRNVIFPPFENEVDLRLMREDDVLAALDLNDVDGSPSSADHTGAAIGTDGCRFVVAYEESIFGLSDKNVYYSMIGLDVTTPNPLQLHEGHVALGTLSTASESELNLAAGPGSGLLAATWTRETSSVRLVAGATLGVPGVTELLNDCCADASPLLVGAGFYDVDTDLALTDGAPVAPGDQIWYDLWWTVQPSQDSVYRIATAGSTFATQLALYRGTGCPAGELLAVDAGGLNGTESEIVVTLYHGETYLLRVGGQEPVDRGEGEVSIEHAFDVVGLQGCAGLPNSTGSPAIAFATGSINSASNDLTLHAVNMPAGSFGYFLASESAGNSFPPGSQGQLCLSGNIARFNAPGQIIVGPSGALAIDLTSIPTNPPQAVVPLDIWHFQLWYRDVNPGPTSNFSNSTFVLFI